MNKKIINIKNTQVVIYTDKEVSNRDYRSILEEAINSDELKDPKIKELYVFDSKEKGKIHKYNVKYSDDGDVVNVGPYHLYEETLRRILSGDILCVTNPFDPFDNYNIFIGFTEEEVRRKATKYYTGL